MKGELEARLLPKGVYVITSQWKRRRAGMTAAWVTRVAGAPPAMLVAIHFGSFTGEVIAQSGWFVINVLGRDQLELARRFGEGSSRDHDKFSELSLTMSAHGQPALGVVLAYLECKVALAPRVGDHILFIGEIMEEQRFQEGIPLLYDPKEFPKQGREKR